MRWMLTGSGGREHALAEHLARSPLIARLMVAPGNAGTNICPKARNVPITANDLDKIVRYVEKERIDVVIVGPEAPLVGGLADRLGGFCQVFGPFQRVAMITEGSKFQAKTFMTAQGIPTAPFRHFTDFSSASAYLKDARYPMVVKADGLAGGKGTTIVRDQRTAIQAAGVHLVGQPGIVVEKFLDGWETSFICLVAGEQFLPLATARDYKYLGEKPTGGMGGYSPDLRVTVALQQKIVQSIVRPTLRGLRKKGYPYLGFLYFGLMITAGGPCVLEMNCRLGDPETESILPRLRSDLARHIMAAFEGKLDSETAVWDRRTAVTVTLASRGYPDKAEEVKLPISLRPPDPNVRLYHGSTVRKNGEQVYRGSGRVHHVTALANDLADSRKRARRAAAEIAWPGAQYLSDIGFLHRRKKNHVSVPEAK